MNDTQRYETVWTAGSEQDTVRLAQRIAGEAQPGTVIALDGDLGAGKTRFSQAFAGALGVPGVVNSPTFTIIKEYEGGRLPFYHMDVYRISMAEADELGLDEYFFGDGVTLVEWASLIEPLLPEKRLQMFIEHLGGEARSIILTGIGEPYASWCRQLDSESAGGAER
ncbi:tRNA (adenosine(37)-N6)-threonylcarbamoyltransferase complex ATPase subunit type 1 TsaE [Paenibacillus tarimensis]